MSIESEGSLISCFCVYPEVGALMNNARAGQIQIFSFPIQLSTKWQLKWVPRINFRHIYRFTF